jgi:hypothetical protein
LTKEKSCPVQAAHRFFVRTQKLYLQEVGELLDIIPIIFIMQLAVWIIFIVESRFDFGEYTFYYQICLGA